MSERLASIHLLTVVRDMFAEEDQLRTLLDVLDLGFGDQELQSLRDELSASGTQEPMRLMFEVAISLGEAHVDRLAEVDEEEVWTELARLLLGEIHAGAWSGADARRLWRRSPGRAAAQLAAVEPLPELALGPTRRWTPRARFRLARQVVESFTRLQGQLISGDCLRCTARALSNWRQTWLVQLLLARLATAEETPEIGYSFTIFTDRMVAPVSATNGIRHGVDTEWEDVVGDDQRPGGDGVVAVAERLDTRRWDWLGRHAGTEASEARLRAGQLFARSRAESPSSGGRAEECWRLRLYSDHRFDDSLRLRVDLRESPNATRADRPLGLELVEIGEPDRTSELPFDVARNAFDIPLQLAGVRPGESYTLLLRVLNAEGFPVSEEQQLRFKVGAGSFEGMPEECLSK